MSKAICPVCLVPMHSAYPGNDPENGPARPVCKEHGVRCIDCGEMTTSGLLSDPPLCDECSRERYADVEPDDSMDGDHASALASAGWGTDEDYGYYGGDED